MTNILLITPLNVPFKDIKDDVATGRKLAPKYPVGLMCIGSYIKNRVPDVNIRIVDYNTEMPRYFAGERKKYSLENMLSYGLSLIPFVPDIIGISAMFDSNLTDMEDTIKYLRFRYPDSIIVAGGHLASACYREFLGFEGLNAVCYGEGEIPMAVLTHSFKHALVGIHFIDFPSWITRRKLRASPGFNPKSSMVSHLDDIPPYDLDMLMWPADYLNTNDDLFALGTERHERDIYMFATRGCPYHCIFCASQFVHGHEVRSYSIERIKDDIRYYHDEYGFTSFPFLDDHFLADKKTALEILDFIEKRGFTCRIFNLNYIHVDRDIIQALKRTGSDRLLITLDGLDEGFLRRVVRKPANFSKAKEVINICHAEKIPIFANIIIGYPGETKQGIANGVRAMRAMGANWYSILIAGPLRGSELRRICEENGYLAPGAELASIDYYHATIRTNEWTPDWIQTRAYEINLELNFVHNYDMLIGDYNAALILFGRVLQIEPNHAFAHYYSALCCLAIGLNGSADFHYDRYREAIRKHPMWEELSRKFELKEI